MAWWFSNEFSAKEDTSNLKFSRNTKAFGKTLIHWSYYLTRMGWREYNLNFDDYDEVVTPDDEIAEDYPCVATMNRWKKWLSDNTTAVDGMLRSLEHRRVPLSTKLPL